MKIIKEIVTGELAISYNYCGPCSDGYGGETNCLTFEDDGETSENIPKEMLKEGILKVLDKFKGPCCDQGCVCC